MSNVSHLVNETSIASSNQYVVVSERIQAVSIQAKWILRSERNVT